MKLIKANKGSALIVSRKGCLEVDEKRKKYHYHNLNNEKLFKGTLITLRFRDNPIINKKIFKKKRINLLFIFMINI